MNNRIKTTLVLWFHPKHVRERFRPTQLKKRFKSKQLVMTLLMSVLIIGGFLSQPYRFGAAPTTDSIDCLAYIWKKALYDDVVDFKRGDYVTFRLKGVGETPEEKAMFEKLRLIKKVGCAPGEYLECGFGVCKCNGIEILSSIDERMATKAFNYTGEVPPTKLFLIGDNEKSYDGRYWGLTGVEHLIGVVEKCIYKRQ